MARSHHRRKHKHFQPPPHTGNHSKQKGKASTILAIAGAFVAFVIGYTATEGNIIWVISITIIGTLLGYFIGRNIDKSGEKK